MWLPTPLGSAKHRAPRLFFERFATLDLGAARRGFQLPSGVGSHIGRAF